MARKSKYVSVFRIKRIKALRCIDAEFTAAFPTKTGTTQSADFYR